LFALINSTALKILIVDDEQLDLFITKKLLGLTYEVIGFHSIKEAAAWAQNNPFDVLLSDYYLGHGMHAPDVLKAIRTVAPNSFRAMVLSNHIDEPQAEALRAAGFHAIIEKPITLEKFQASLTG
jgi:response regulator RpfG family c-di-GMP phosphodiesterase